MHVCRRELRKDKDALASKVRQEKSSEGAISARAYLERSATVNELRALRGKVRCV